MTSRAVSDVRDLLPRNLKCTRDPAPAWPDQVIVQGPLAQIIRLEPDCRVQAAHLLVVVP